MPKWCPWHNRKRDPSGWVAPSRDDARKWTDHIARIHAELPEVPAEPRGIATPPRNPDEQCWWCLSYFGPGVTAGGSLWNGHQLCQRCADTVDRRRG